MKNTAVKFINILIISLLSAAPALGEIIKEERAVSDFERVRLSGSGTVYVAQGEEEKLVVEAYASIMPYILTEVSGTTLKLGLKKFRRPRLHTGNINYYLTMKNVSGFQISGSGNFIAENIKSDDIDFGISGSGDINVKNLRCDDITASISGSGNCNLDGKADNQDIHISGSGEYFAADLKSDQAEVSVSGSGDVTLWAENDLDVSVSGSGKVGYYGRPAVSSRSSGSGTTKHLGDR